METENIIENIIETYTEEDGRAWYSTFIELLLNDMRLKTEDFEKYKLQKRRHENISKLLEL
jgi:hypothetical protein